MSRLYIGRIPNSASRHDVERFLRGYGRVQEIVMMKNYAFVELNDSRDVEDAVHDLNGRNLAGSRVIVERTRLPPRFRRQRHHSPPRRPPPFKQQRFRGPKFGPPQRTDYRIIVDNLSSRISWQDLKDIMRKVGDVTFAGAHMTKRNEGVVEFVNSSDMRRAIEKYNGYVLYGRKLRVFQDRERRSSSRSPSGSPPTSRKHHSHKRSRHSHKYRESRSRSHSSRRSSPQEDDDERRGRSRSRTRSRSPVRRTSKSPESDKQSKHSKDMSPSGDVRDEVSDTKSNEREGSVKSERSVNLSQSPRSNTVNDENEDQSDEGSHRSASP